MKQISDVMKALFQSIVTFMLLSILAFSSAADLKGIPEADGDIRLSKAAGNSSMLPHTSPTTVNKVNLTFPILLSRGAQIRKITPEEAALIRSNPDNKNALNSTLRGSDVTLASLSQWLVYEKPSDNYNPHAIIWNIEGEKGSNIEEQLSHTFYVPRIHNLVLRFEVVYVSLGTRDKGRLGRSTSFITEELNGKERERIITQEQIDYRNPFQPSEVDTREFVSTLLPTIMGDQLVAVEHVEGALIVDGVYVPQSKRVELHQTLDDPSWHDRWLLGAKPRDTNYIWDDVENYNLHPRGGIPDTEYEKLMEKVREATGTMHFTQGFPRKSFVESIVKNVAVMRETEVHIETIKEAKGRIWFAPLSLFSPAVQLHMKKEYWRLMPNSSSMKEALSQGDPFAVICANEFRFVNPNVLQEASLQGDAEALSVMGRCYLNGISYDDLLNNGGQGYASRWLPKLSKFPKDQTKAIELLQSAAEKGSIDACISLGEHFCAQPGQEHLGRLYYLIASYVGHPLAHLNLGLEYLNTKKPIQNVTNEQREVRAIWHLLRAINCNREFMSHYIRGEQLRVKCHDHAGTLLDRLIGPSLNIYAKSEMQKIVMPWPMKWNKSPTQTGAGVLAAAEEWQNQLDDYFRREVPSPSSATQ